MAGELVLTAAAAAAALLVAVPVAVGLFVAVLTARFGWRSRWAVLTGLLLLSVLAAAAGWRPLASYTAPYRESAAVLLHQESAAGRSTATVTAARGSWPSLAGQRWGGWLAGQLPLGLATGVLTGGAGAAWWKVRRRRSEPWRAEAARPLGGRRAARATRRMLRGPASDAVRLGVVRATGAPVRLPLEQLRRHTLLAGATGGGKTTTIVRWVAEILELPAAVGRRERLRRAAAALRDQKQSGVVAGLRSAVGELQALPAARPARLKTSAAVVVDMKGDPGLVAELRSLADRFGRPFRLISLPARLGMSYNPIAVGDYTAVANRLMEMEDRNPGGGFSEPHYKAAAARYLQLAVRVLDTLVQTADRADDLPAAGDDAVFSRSARRPAPARAPVSWRRDLPCLARLMTPPQLQAATGRCPDPELAAQVAAYLQGLTKDQESGIAGLATRFAQLTESTQASLLTAAPDTLALGAAIREGAVVLFSLSAAELPVLSRQVGAAVLSDLISTADGLQADDYAERGLAAVVVDEFSALGSETVAGLFARGRSAGLGLLLSTQSLADLRAASPGLLAQVVGNSAVKIVHTVPDPDDAEYLARVAGTESGFEATSQVITGWTPLGPRRAGASGVASLRDVESYLVHPNTLKSLPTGVAVVIARSPSGAITATTTRIARVTPPATPVVPAQPGDAPPPGGQIPLPADPTETRETAR